MNLPINQSRVHIPAANVGDSLRDRHVDVFITRASLRVSYCCINRWVWGKELFGIGFVWFDEVRG